MSEKEKSNSTGGLLDNATWLAILRITLKAAVLFVLLNVIFAALTPLEPLGSISVYNTILPGRLRLPYGEEPARAYNLSLNNVPAMMASHTLSQEKADDEFRLLILGDSGVWGWLLDNEDTLAGQINQQMLFTRDGRRVVAYNLGYPIMSLTKDLMLLDAALAYDPDLILWPVTLASFSRAEQLEHPLLQNNPDRVGRLIEAYDLELNAQDPRFVRPNFIENTIIGRRRPLADLLRLQSYGYSWAATGIDQALPQEITLRKSDFDEDISWDDVEEPVDLTEEELTMDVLAAGLTLAGDVPVLIVNEPIFISDGQNSHLRYNAWYPRWAYDSYRDLLGFTTGIREWSYLDLWDSIPADEFTDSPVHLTPAGSKALADLVLPAILEMANSP